jgi:signal transduction histidine kinase
MNIKKHAGAGQVVIEMVYEETSVRLSVQDNGVGFDPKSPAQNRFGLIGMRERARLVGGSLGVTSEKGKGTRVAVTIPVGGVEVNG